MSTQIDQRPAERRPEPEERRPVAGVVVVLVVLAVAALSVGYLTRGRTTVRTDASPVATAPTTLVPPAPPAPVLLNTVQAAPDFEAIVRSIVDFDAWLRVHPDPARLTDFMDPANPSFAEALAAQRRLATGEIRYDPVPGAPPVAVARVTTAEASAATVFVRYDSVPGYRVVDRSGAVVSDTPAKAGNSTAWKLRYSDGRWRILGTTPL